MNDILNSLKSSPIAKRVSYEDIEVQENLFEDRLKDATKPREISIQDALISAAIRTLPSLLGATIGGKQGAISGLKGGAVGGDIYNTLEQQRFNDERVEKQALATQAQRDLVRVQGNKDNQDLRALDKLDRVELLQLQHKLKDLVRVQGNKDTQDLRVLDKLDRIELLQFQHKLKDLGRVQGNKDTQDLRALDKSDKIELLRLQHKLIASRAQGKPMSTSDVAILSILQRMHSGLPTTGGGGEALPTTGGGGEALPTTGGGTGATSATPSGGYQQASSTEELGLKGAYNIAQDLEQNVTSEDVAKGGSGVLNTTLTLKNKALDGENKGQSLEKGKLDIRSRALDLANKETEQTWKTRPWEVGKHFVGIPKPGGIIVEPEVAQKLTTQYGLALDAINDLNDLYLNNSPWALSGGDPSAASKASKVQAALINALTQLQTTNTEARGSGTETIRKALDQTTVKIDGLFNNLSNFIMQHSALPAKTIASNLKAEEDALRKLAIGNLGGIGLELPPNPNDYFMKNKKTGEWEAIIGLDKNGNKVGKGLGVGFNTQTVVNDYVKGLQ